jgi:hypothetical protein
VFQTITVQGGYAIIDDIEYFGEPCKAGGAGALTKQRGSPDTNDLVS